MQQLNATEIAHPPYSDEYMKRLAEGKQSRKK
jgi:hypothetical protein